MKQFIIEGNIGTGKTTLLNALSKEPNTEVFYEPLDVWESIQDGEGKSLLECFYNDPKRYSYLFQSIVFKTRLKYLDVPQRADIRYMERSILTDYYVFMKTLFDLELISDIERECYEQWYHWLKERHFTIPTAIIYIRTDPTICYDRIMKRNRSAEINISMDYLERIHNKHEEWLNEWEACPVYVIDNPGEGTIEELVFKIKRVIDSN